MRRQRINHFIEFKFNVFLSCYRILSCGFLCELPDDVTSEEAESIVHAHSYDVHLQSRINSQHLVYRHTVSSLLTQTRGPKKDQSTSRIMTNDPYFNTTVSKISDNEIFFPAPQLYQIECSQDLSNASCAFGRNDFITHIDEGDMVMKYRVRISHDAQTVPADVKSYWVRAISSDNVTKFDDNYEGSDSTACHDNFGVVSIESTIII